MHSGHSRAKIVRRGRPPWVRATRLGPNTATLGRPGSGPEGGGRKAESERRPMLGAPLGAGAAHVMQFRPVVIASAPARMRNMPARSASALQARQRWVNVRLVGVMTLSARLFARAPFLLVTAPTATFNALALNIGKTSPRSSAAMIEIRPPPRGGCACHSVPGAAQREP